MDRLAIYLTLLSGSAITGAIVITGLAMGYYSVWTIVIGAVTGFLLAWPTSYMISRRIKRQDPEWHPGTKPSDHGVVPKPGAPEV